jgi:F-type H+-transporting ATPase subunit gamma
LANLRDIKRRITSVQSTQKITSAMKMVAAAKLRRAQDAIESGRPYAQRMRETLEEVAAGSPDAEHRLFDRREDKQGRTLEIVAVTSDRGLAGAFNSQINKAVDALIAKREPHYEKIRISCVGKKAADYYKRRRPSQLELVHLVRATVTYDEAQGVAKNVMERFLDDQVDEVVLVYNEFKSTMTQTPRIVQLLPFQAAEGDSRDDEEKEEDHKVEHEIEPSPEALLATLVPRAVEVEVYRAMLENQAGEHAARMTAMESATKNTEELIEKLTLQYNRARQAAITRELVEIVTGAQALE